MDPVLTVSEMRAVDEIAQRSEPISALITRAGTAVAVEALRLLGPGGAYGRRVVVVAGPGNNGNDGRLAASRLVRRGARVALLDARDAPLEIAGADLVIDAAFGTGYRGSYDAPDPRGAPVLAVDLPTGVDADSGAASVGAVRAACTVTFGALKPGLLLGDGPDRCGEVVKRPIGLPVAEVAASIHLVGDEDVVALLPERERSGHKWKHAVMAVAGSPGMYGAANYVAAGAGRGGAGMVRLGVPGAAPDSLPATTAVARSLPQEGFEAEVLEEIGRFRALVVGPGLGTAEATATAVRVLVSLAGVPTVVDADGLTALGGAEEAAEVIRAREGAPIVLTPHDGEFARLSGAAPGTDRIGDVRRLASRTGAIVLLKGSTTIVAAPDGQVLLAAAGSARLATAGSGDVLSGVIGAVLARGVGALEAAALAAHVHGRAAGLGREEGLLASDLPALVADVLSAAARERARRRAASLGGDRLTVQRPHG
ncbi:MAG TPA: NAD(P)H-hydrate dehydratase [Acidimicrobiales bacterium]|nr:NAD(P)H-hydrate dehydratase [Acidimicrobiales bacterium]